MKVIAIHDGHNASVGYMKDGVVLFAIQEERLTRHKNQGGFPEHALKETLSRTNNALNDIDHFVFVGHSSSHTLHSRDDVLRKYKRLFYVTQRQFQTLHNIVRLVARKLAPKLLDRRHKQRVHREQSIRFSYLSRHGVSRKKIHFIDHHTCHAASAAYGSGKKEKTAVITSDSSGDNISGTVSLFEDGVLTRKAKIDIGDSIARVYALTTFFLGMVPTEHEYKIMGLSPYAENNTQAREIADNFLELFEYDTPLTYRRKANIESVHMFGPRLKKMFELQRFDNISAGIQIFVEEFVSEWIQRIVADLQVHRVALAGGLFMNVKLNQRIAELNNVNDVYIFPSCGDESNIFGALYYFWNIRSGTSPKSLTDYYLGGAFNDEEINSAIEAFQKSTSHTISISRPKDIDATVAKLIASNIIVARFNGRMEFGARSLGNRSILSNPGNASGVKTINKMIKSRDFWMPFAPSMTRPKDFLVNPKNIEAPYMILTFQTKKEKQDALTAAIHPYDETARPQIVYKDWNAKYYDLIEAVGEHTGNHVVLNTSFNLHGYPVVYTPQDALAVFEKSGLEYLAIGNYIITKKISADAQ